MKKFKVLPVNNVKRVDFTEILPPETIATIVKLVDDVVDYMSLQLTCREMAAHMQSKLGEVMTERGYFDVILHSVWCNINPCESGCTRTEVRRQHMQALRILENRIRRDRQPGAINILLCTACGQIKSSERFTDYHRTALRDEESALKPKARHARRSCIHCQLRWGTWSSQIYCADVDGIMQFACVSCRRFVPAERRFTGSAKRSRFDAVTTDSSGKIPVRDNRRLDKVYMDTWELCHPCAKLIKKTSVPEDVLKELIKKTSVPKDVLKELKER